VRDYSDWRMMDPVAELRSGASVRLERAAFRWRREFEGEEPDEYWVAFRRPRDWVVLDLQRRNGEMFIEGWESGPSFLIVEGLVAAESPALHPGYMEVHAVVEQGSPVFTRDPDRSSLGEADGRPAEVLIWDYPSGSVTVTYDVATGLCLSMTTPTESAAITELLVDEDVPEDWFEVPARHDHWRGGTAFVGAEPDDGGSYSVSWQPGSGPGLVEVRSPDGMTRDQALSWARSRAERVVFDG
jgi:hypothetical protein